MGVQSAGNVTLSPALAGEIRLQLQMVALQTDDLLQKRQQIVGGGHGSAIKFGGLGRILAGDGPEYGKVLHFDVPCQEPPDPAQVPEHTADKGGRIMSEQVEGGLDTLRNMERRALDFGCSPVNSVAGAGVGAAFAATEACGDCAAGAAAGAGCVLDSAGSALGCAAGAGCGAAGCCAAVSLAAAVAKA